MLKKVSWVFLGLAMLLVIHTANSAEAVKIGVMGPVTGAWASEGQDMVNVVTILADAANASGGVNGRQIEIEVGDDGGDPRTAVLAAQRLVSSGAIAVVGTYGSAITEASQGIYDDEGVVQIATGSTAIRLSEKGMALFFRTCPRDDDQGKYLAGKVESLGAKSVALLHDNSSYAKGLADECKALFETGGIKVVFYDAITAGDRDFTTSLVAMKSLNPDMIVFTGYYPEAAMLLRQKMSMGWNVPMIGGDATNNTALIEISGKEAADGYLFVSPPGPLDLSGPAAKQFMGEYEKKYGTIPTSVWSIMAGDAFLTIVEAAKNIKGDITSKSIGDYLHSSLKKYPGFTGEISYDAKGDRIGDIYRLYKVDSNGVFRLVP
ncbi:MAG: branched-chain amino acid ABC transporter substrate-binding protein [Planctomycetota bacterium]|jgi:branched-chain amino acid transport system substrate-binding protein|nr:branched-chain amino acid ABC transporter substrate-binding protein [Planctomycetota bacterium]